MVGRLRINFWKRLYRILNDFKRYNIIYFLNDLLHLPFSPKETQVVYISFHSAILLSQQICEVGLAEYA